ncbi:hypothetical protein BGW36DRAFT_350080 [Talaromyces proteolyticus]|uniref:Glycosyl hydrolase family 13 catalytic domain-containing protein n=1 Tax=Talaromyces proteolyticus TaxID=1131652 RepID=A0AAD4KGK7_9EURO|nr:uncharacterized protein BGW36DRAFT_350080 [Talaromyces proteolyticus]KAH8690618.1 hypothetical protein BGW36DRAFT_350080 [Talaromyces proteolyticus]
MHSWNSGRNWWKDEVVYQIWPASFKDSNGDGWGDIGGVIDSLDYIKDLGTNIVWLSPIFDSPQEDMGYDISNYEDIYRPFGTVSDVETLIEACHKRDIRIILDLVVNHTSDQHQWFKESRSSRDNPKRDWYIWRQARYNENGNRMPPNNWRSNFSGSAWQWDEPTQEYYLHLFAKSQPDLNWENPAMRQAVYDSAMKFWLDKGVDGFRIDTITIYSKDPSFPDAPVLDNSSPWQLASCHYRNKPRNFDHISEMNEKVLSKYDIMTVGEYGPTYDTSLALKYCSASEKRIDMGFQFETVYIGFGKIDKFQYEPFTLGEFKRRHAKWQTFIEGNDGWTSAFLENHDLPRSVSRFGSDKPEFWAVSAKMLAMMLVTTTGTLFIYQGQEIGMTNIPKEWTIEEYQDVEAKNYYAAVKDATRGHESALKRAMDGVRHVGRDHARTPMQWSDAANAGFSTGKPWMRVNDNYRDINVRNQLADKKSVLSFWKALIRLRRQYIDIFAHGSFSYLDEGESVMTYVKKFNSQRVLVALNFTSDEHIFSLRKEWSSANLLACNIDHPEDQKLSPWEGRIYSIQI